MKRDFVLGVLFGVGFLSLCAFTKLRPNYNSFKDVDQEFSYLYDSLETFTFRLETSTPTMNLVRDHEVFFIQDRGVRFGVRIGTNVYYSEMKKI